MKLINKTKKEVISKNVKICKSDWCKARGLMFSKEEKDFALIFPFNKPRKQSLHMFFVFYPIDLVFLNENKEVIEIKENFKPFTTYYSKKKSAYIIEVPFETIAKKKISLGDILKF